MSAKDEREQTQKKRANVRSAPSPPHPLFALLPFSPHPSSIVTSWGSFILNILNETMHNFNGFHQFTFTIIKYDDRPSLQGAIYLV